MNRTTAPVAGGKFVSRVFHDLKQPLNVIRTLAQEVALDVRRKRLDADALPDRMKEIVDAVDRLVGRLEQVRAFAARVREPDEPGGADPVDVCLLAARRAARTSGRKTEITLRFEPHLTRTIVPAHALRRAVEELLDNGIEAAEQAGADPAISIDARAHIDGIAITVRDNGRGVRPDDVARVFEPFFTTGHPKGGLGLALASSIVAEYGGAVALDDPGPVGASFTLVVPRKVDA